MESKQSEPSQREILSGWKEIAHYMGKGVRTVQRYERELGLPVRRPSGRRPSAVAALKSELDSWLTSSPSGREPLDASPLPKQVYLRSELAKTLQERAHFQAQMMALRKELRANIRTVRESVAKLRQKLNETQKHQDSIASLVSEYSKVWHRLPLDVKHRKPN